MAFARQLFTIFLITCYLSLVTSPSAQAQTMSNQNYIIQTQNINTATNLSEETNDKRQTTNDKDNSSISEGVNFKVKSGFESAKPALPFSISLSSDSVDFGIISPTNPIIRTVNLSVNNPPLYGYSIIAFENHTLSNDTSNIPDATCDNGHCSYENAEAWTNALTYGFGYRCDNVTGADCDNSFSSPNFYKHFPNISNSESVQSVMNGIGSGNRNIQLSYKVNISGNQPKGIYNNTITYIAVPNF